MCRILFYDIAVTANSFIILESQSAYPNETGGILVGRMVGECVYVSTATPPGPKARHSMRGFRRDGQNSQELLDQTVAESKGEFDYIGEWHSHPIKSGPSGIDRAAMHWIATNEKYATTTPIMILCTPRSKDRWGLEVFLYDTGELTRLKKHR